MKNVQVIAAALTAAGYKNEVTNTVNRLEDGRISLIGTNLSVTVGYNEMNVVATSPDGSRMKFFEFRKPREIEMLLSDIKRAAEYKFMTQ